MTQQQCAQTLYRTLQLTPTKETIRREISKLRARDLFFFWKMLNSRMQWTLDVGLSLSLSLPGYMKHKGADRIIYDSRLCHYKFFIDVYSRDVYSKSMGRGGTWRAGLHAPTFLSYF